MRLIVQICHLMKRLNISQLASICILIKSVNKSSWHGPIHDCHLMGYPNRHVLGAHTANKQHTAAGDTPEWIFRHATDPTLKHVAIDCCRVGVDLMPRRSFTEPKLCCIQYIHKCTSG